MFIEKIIRELWDVKGIDHPYSYYGEADYRKIYNIMRTDNDKELKTLKWLAEKLDVPTTFFINVLKYEEIKEND